MPTSDTPLRARAALRASALLLLAGAAPAQLGAREVPWPISSGLHAGGAEWHLPVFETVVEVPDAPWLRLRFAAADLGSTSFLLVTSLHDGAHQVLDARSIVHYGMRTAGFNGDSVSIELFAGPGDAGVHFELGEVIAGEQTTGSTQELWCGNGSGGVISDDRVGRLGGIVLEGGCTAWRVTNGALVTAGHCGASEGDIVEFRVPPSLSDGTPQWALPEDQYAIDGATVVAMNDQSVGPGKDWAVFGVYPNSNTSLLPHQVYSRLPFRMSRDVTGGTTRIYGYGYDASPQGSSGGYNSDHRVLQTETGPYDREHSDGPWVWHEYDVITERGTSGGPIVFDSLGLAIGVNSHGGCAASGASGTSFETDALEDAVHAFPGPVVRYVDGGHPLAPGFGDGGVLRPFLDILSGSNAMPASGGVLSVVTGSYPSGSGLVLDRALVIEAPIGPVVIGD